MLLFLPFSVLDLFFVRVKDLAPTEAPLSNRKHRSSNASSVAPPLIPCLCDITLCHRVTRLRLVASLASSGSGVCKLTNQRRGGRGLKETVAETEHLWHEKTEACKPLQVVTQK